MTTTSRPRSTRDRPAKPPLSEDAVVEAALAILRAEGLDAVSMRRVATALDTGAGSLYVYFAGRDGLLAAMRDRVIATVALEPPAPARWREQLHALLIRMRAALVAHPGIAPRLWPTRRGPRPPCCCWRTCLASCSPGVSHRRTRLGAPTSWRRW